MLQEKFNADGWVAQFAASRSETEVVRLANEYLATWLPSDLEHLPKECRLTHMADADAVAYAAVIFTQCELHAKPETPAASILSSLAEVFIAAHVRVRQLRSPRFDPAA